MNQQTFERVFKAFCDETRLMVLFMLQKQPMYGSQLLQQVHVGQSTLSHHMRILIESGIVRAERSGKKTVYTIAADGLTYCHTLLTEFESGIQTVHDETQSNQPRDEYQDDRQTERERLPRSPRAKEDIWLL